jgi:hypothetical protein
MKLLHRGLAALCALAALSLATAASAACVAYPGNTSGTDSAAMVSHLSQLCDKLDAPAAPTGSATAAKQDTGNTSLGSIDTKLSSAATAANQAAANASLSSIDTKAVAPWASRISASVNRPGNTTPYTANTAWANATSGATYMTFTNVCRANGTTVLITHVIVDDFANQTTKLQGVLWLFNAVPTAINDNVTFSLASADMATKVAAIDFTASKVTNQAAGASGSTTAELPGAGIQAGCAAGDRNLYGLFQVVNAYVPVSAEVLTGRLKVVGVD